MTKSSRIYEFQFRLDTRQRTASDYQNTRTFIYRSIELIAEDRIWDDGTSTIIFRTKQSLKYIALILSFGLQEDNDHFILKRFHSGKGFFWGDIENPKLLNSLTGLSRFESED